MDRRDASRLVATMVTTTFIGMPDGSVLVVATIRQEYIGEMDYLEGLLDRCFGGEPLTASEMAYVQRVFELCFRDEAPGMSLSRTATGAIPMPSAGSYDRAGG